MFCQMKIVYLGPSECWVVVFVFFLRSLFKVTCGCLDCMMCDLGILNH